MIASTFIYSAVILLAIFNGIFSPYSFTVFALQGIWYPKILPAPLKMMFVVSGIISSLLHLMITSIPAAFLEKHVPLMRVTTGLVWLGAMLLPTYQTLRHLGWL